MVLGEGPSRVRAYSYLPHTLLIASNTSAPPPYAPPTERVLVVLRDGRNLVGMLRSFDQFCKLPRPTRRMFIDLRATQPCWASVLSIPSALLRGTPCLLPCCLVLRARTLSFASVSDNAPPLSPSCFPGWIQCRLACVSASVTYKRGSAFTPLTPPSPLLRTHTRAPPIVHLLSSKCGVGGYVRAALRRGEVWGTGAGVVYYSGRESGSSGGNGERERRERDKRATRQDLRSPV